MNDNVIKRLVILFAIIIVIIIIITLLILLEKNKMEEANGFNINTNTIEETSENIGNVIKIEDKKRFYTVSECISKYLKDDLFFIPLQMNMLEGSNIDTYSVYGFVIDKNYENIQYSYFIVKLDSFNKTYSVEKLQKEYNNIDEIELYNENIEITYNENNNFLYVEVNDTYVVKKYINYYKIMVLSNPELIYNYFLDTEYKNEKFTNAEDFKQYISNNKTNLLDIVAMEYTVEQFDNYKQYTIMDNHNNYYIIKEKNTMDFSMMLDNYTVQSEEFDAEYESASDEVKIATNLDKIFKMINNKEYNRIYENYLNEEFKNKYFSNYQNFEEFMKNKFFDYNYLGRTLIDNQANYYIVNVNYKEGLSSAAEERNTNIILKLNENTDFEFSFEM